MHAKHRSPGNGYRSGGIGMGSLATGSRISPEGSLRGQGFYNSGYRNYNRGGYGRGRSRQFHPPQRPPPPQPKGGDIFMEAGRLATEYLVSKGLLPPNTLSGKWQNGRSKNQLGDFQGFGLQEGDTAHLSTDARLSALDRLGNAGGDIGPGRRRYSDEYNSTGSRGYIRGGRRNGSFKSYGSEWNREIGSSRSYSDRTRNSADVEGEDDALSAQEDEQQVLKDCDSGLQNPPPSQSTPESGSVGETGSSLEKHKSGDDVDATDADAKASSSTSTKTDLPSETDAESTEKPENMKASNEVASEDKRAISNDETEQQGTKEDAEVECGPEKDYLESKKTNEDLLTLCRFQKIPTRTRSSLTTKSAKVDLAPIAEDKSKHESGLSEGSAANTEDMSIDNSSDLVLSNQNHNSNSLEPHVSKPLDVKEQLSLAYDGGQGKCERSRSFPPERSSTNGQQINGRLPELGRCSSMFMERGAKRAAEDGDGREGSKKPREWVNLMDTMSDDCMELTNGMKDQRRPQEPIGIKSEAMSLSPDRSRLDGNRLVNRSLFPKGESEPSIQFTEEKQLFPGSFKTCDLNLMESCDMNENRGSDTIITFPSITESGKQAAPVDIGLCMSNNGGISDKYGKSGLGVKDIEVIDLENDCGQEDKPLNVPERRSENLFTGLDGFANTAPNANDISDAQDGYGLMISELLGNDIPNCSSVPGDMNSLNNDMGLPSGEGILGDDDSIYMSLGEIPISFLRGWEQPTQEYGKPF